MQTRCKNRPLVIFGKLVEKYTGTISCLNYFQKRVEDMTSVA